MELSSLKIKLKDLRGNNLVFKTGSPNNQRPILYPPFHCDVISFLIQVLMNKAKKGARFSYNEGRTVNTRHCRLRSCNSKPNHPVDT